MGRRAINLKGRVFGDLTVMEAAPPGRRSNGVAFTRWRVKCACGNEKITSSVCLRHGRTVSCGCHKLRVLRQNGERNRLPLGVSARNEIFHRYKAQAKYRNLPWALTKEQFTALVSGICHYCGVPPCTMWTRGPVPFAYNGVDRKDNAVGYLEGNVVSCCKTCNWAKGRVGYNEFIAYLERIKIFRA